MDKIIVDVKTGTTKTVQLSQAEVNRANVNTAKELEAKPMRIWLEDISNHSMVRELEDLYTAIENTAPEVYAALPFEARDKHTAKKEIRARKPT